MKAKHLLLVIVALLAAGGLWLARSAWRTHPPDESSMGIGIKMPAGQRPDQMLRPPDPNRKYRDLTPEQRVQLARRGPIGG